MPVNNIRKKESISRCRSAPSSFDLFREKAGQSENERGVTA